MSLVSSAALQAKGGPGVLPCALEPVSSWGVGLGVSCMGDALTAVGCGKTLPFPGALLIRCPGWGQGLGQVPFPSLAFSVSLAHLVQVVVESGERVAAPRARPLCPAEAVCAAHGQT